MKFLTFLLLGLISVSCVADSSQVTLKSVDENKIQVLIDGQLFTEYLQGDQKPYLYPIIGPTGIGMTRNFPMKKDVKGESQDHPWQSSVYYTHGSVNGLDFWNDGNKKQKNCRILLDKLISADSNNNKAAIKASHKWMHEEKVLMTDETEITFSADEAKRMIDFTITLIASEGDVKLGDTKEGCMAVRMHQMLRVKDRKAKVVNSEGVSGKKVWGKPAKWITYYNDINGKAVGITMMDHPDNLRYPTTWHARDYGLCAANPFGLKHFLKGQKKDGTYTINKGEKLTFKYRLIFHEGNHENIKAEEIHSSWVKK